MVLPMLLWLLILIASTATFGLSVVSGGGAGLILIPLLGLVLSGAQVPAALSIGTAVSSASRIVLFGKTIRWDIVSHFAPTALPFTALGAWALSRVSPVYLSLLLGLFLMGNLPLLFRKHHAVKNEKPIRPIWLHALGCAAGFISGFTGAVGLIFNGFYYRLGLRKEEIIATRAANEIMMHLFKIALYAALGIVNENVVAIGGAIAVAAILASIIMRYLLPHLNDHLFRHIGHAVMVVAGVAMVFSAVSQIAHQNDIMVPHAEAFESSATHATQARCPTGKS